ncbi:MAG: murein biosynthesis integral membrane protein MurJ [Proteobacteria bacterium]|nr:murein biosynthesis integral membrane protein MurJ [Pseudomonadota bacterium]
MSEKKRAAKAAMTIGAFTILSRVLGLVRDIVIAGFFGAGYCSDAFFAAFRIPNLLRRLFAEGALSISFIPVFTEYLEKKGRDEAFYMARSAIRLLTIILAIVTVLGMLFSPQIARLLGYGFDSPEVVRLTADLTRILFPYIFFISLVALAMGILNTLDHFAAPAMAPMFLNIFMIASVSLVSLFSDSDETRIKGLAYGVLMGGVAQLVVQIPFLMKKGIYFWQKANVFHPGLKKVGQLMMPAVFGAAAYQINVLIGIVLASTLDEGCITYLYYADRLVQLPLGIFAISAATAILPSLSRQAAVNDLKGLNDTFIEAIKQIFFITLPASVGLIVLREPIVKCLFQRGAFDETASIMTSDALLYFSIGLFAFSSVRILIAVFNAFSDTKTPARMSFATIFLNVIFSMVLIKPLGHGGLALSTTLASIFQMVFLLVLLNRRIKGFLWQGVSVSFFKSFFASVLMGGFLFLMNTYFMPEKIVSVTGYFFNLMVCIVSGVAFFILTCIAIGSEELKQFLRALKGA